MFLNASKCSQNVFKCTCFQMVANASECYQILAHASKCLQMLPNASQMLPKCFPNAPSCHFAFCICTPVALKRSRLERCGGGHSPKKNKIKRLKLSSKCSRIGAGTMLGEGRRVSRCLRLTTGLSSPLHSYYEIKLVGTLGTNLAHPRWGVP